MRETLVKSWGPYPPGTVIVDSLEEQQETPGAVRVNAMRFNELLRDGHFSAAAAPASAIEPEEGD